jgi:TonB family protein
MSATLAAVLLLSAQSAAPPDRPPPSTTDMPGWSRTPSAADMARAYPQEAMRVNLAGSAVLECTVDPKGGLTDCVAAEETPPGSGFAAATLAVAARFAMPTRSPSGAATAGRTVRFPVNWLNPATSQAPPIVFYVDDGRSGTIGFNCRVRDDRNMDNCVIVEAMPRGTSVVGAASETLQRAKAPSRAKPWSRIFVLVEAKAR